MNFSISILIFYCYICYTVDAWSSGAPSSACRSMTPGHGNSIQTSPSPISLSLSKGKYFVVNLVYLNERGSKYNASEDIHSISLIFR